MKREVSNRSNMSSQTQLVGTVGEQPELDQSRFTTGRDDGRIRRQPQSPHRSRLTFKHAEWRTLHRIEDSDAAGLITGHNDRAVRDGSDSVDRHHMPGEQSGRGDRQLPQLDRAIVSTGQQSLSCRVKREALDRSDVSSENAGRAAVFAVPQTDDARCVGRSDQLVIFANGHRRNGFHMPGKFQQYLPGFGVCRRGQLPDLRGFVRTSRHNPRPIAADSDRSDRVGMSGKPSQWIGAKHVPQLDRRVARCRHKLPAVGRNIQSQHLPRVTGQRPQQGRVCGIPDANGPIKTASRDETAIRRVVRRRDRELVPFQSRSHSVDRLLALQSDRAGNRAHPEDGGEQQNPV